MPYITLSSPKGFSCRGLGGCLADPQNSTDHTIIETSTDQQSPEFRLRHDLIEHEKELDPFRRPIEAIRNIGLPYIIKTADFILLILQDLGLEDHHEFPRGKPMQGSPE